MIHYLRNVQKAPPQSSEQIGEPRRKIVLWGWGENGFPGFIVLYGTNAAYTHYDILLGSEGHFPSIGLVKEESKKALDKPLTIPYGSWTQETVVKLVKGKSFSLFGLKKSSEPMLNGFRLANDPSEVLGLSPEYQEYYDILVLLFCYPNLYIRKKYCRELIRMNPPQSLCRWLLQAGSSELVSGLFLELAVQGNDCLVPDALRLIESNPTWADIAFISGVKRCAALYVNTFDESARQKRIDWLQKIFVPDQNLPPADAKKAKIAVKNAIQEAEVYGLADVVGAVGGFINTWQPQHKYFKMIFYGRANDYFRRYIRRIIDAWALTDEDKFVLAAKTLLLRQNKYPKSNYYIDRYLTGSAEIWARHLETLIEIASETESAVVASCAAVILLEPGNARRLRYEDLFRLFEAKVQQVRDAVMPLLTEKLADKSAFDLNLYRWLLGCREPEIQKLADQYICSVPYESLKAFLLAPDAPQFYYGSPDLTTALLGYVQIHNFPSDGLLNDVLTQGTDYLVSLMTEMAFEFKVQLLSRTSTLLLLLESDMAALKSLAQETVRRIGNDEKVLKAILDSPVPSAYMFGFERLQELYGEIPLAFFVRLLEHPAVDIQKYAAARVKNILREPNLVEADLFLYYAKVVLFRPNQLRAEKSLLFAAFPEFVQLHPEHKAVVEELLLDLGGSNIRRDSEHALLTLASIKKEEGPPCK